MSLKENLPTASFDVALKETKFGKFNYALILLCGFLFVCWFFEITGIGFYLPLAECDLGIKSKQDYGIVNGFGFAGIIISFHLWGFLADTKGRRKVMIPTLVIAFLFSIVSSLSTSFWMFTISRFFNGFFVAASSSTTYAYLGEFHHTKIRSKVMIVSSCFYIIFSMLLPLGAWVILAPKWSFLIPLINVRFSPWRLCTLFTGLPNIICAVCLIWFPESPKFTYSMGNEDGTIKILSKIHTINTRAQHYPIKKIHDSELNSIESSAKDYFKKIWTQTKLLFSKSYLRPTAVLCFLQIGACAYGTALFIFFPKIITAVAEFESTYQGDTSKTLCEIIEITNPSGNQTLVEKGKDCIQDLAVTAYIYPIMILTVCAGFFLVTSFVVNYTGVIPMSITLYAVNLIGSVAIIFSKIPTLSMYLCALVILSGGNNNLIGSATIEYYPTNLRSSAVSISLIFGRTGSIMGSNVLGYFFDHNCIVVFLICAVSFMFCCLIATLLPRVKTSETS